MDILLALTALTVGVLWAMRLAATAPPAPPLRAQAPAKPSASSPLRDVLASTRDTRALAERAAGWSRAYLAERVAERGLPAERAKLTPVLQHLVAGAPLQAWWRVEARSRYRGPPGLFWAWYALRSALENDEARSLRYVETLSKDLDAWVRNAP